MDTRFANNIRALREAKGLTQAEIAQKLGFPTTTWGSYELSKSQPSMENMIKIADFFGISIDGLLRRHVNLIAKEFVKRKEQNVNPSVNPFVNPIVEEPDIEYLLKEARELNKSGELDPKKGLITAITAVFRYLLDLDDRLNNLERGRGKEPKK